MLSAGLALDGTADFAVLLDDDDPAAAGYALIRGGLDEAWPGRIWWRTGPRDTMPGWTNTAAASPLAKRYEALGSIGDDHIPQTPGWSAALACMLAHTGLAYGDDLHQRENLPTYCLMLRAVTDALGWMCLPGLVHYDADSAWLELGAVYVPESVAEHFHPVWGNAPGDATYDDAGPSFGADKAVFEAWRDGPGGTRDRATAARATQEAAWIRT